MSDEMTDFEVVQDVMKDLLDRVEAVVDEEESSEEELSEEEEEEESEEALYDEEGDDEKGAESIGEVDQTGGARYKILKVVKGSAGGRFAQAFKKVKIQMILNREMTADPRGSELFAKLVEKLIQEHKPDNANRSSCVGVSFKTDEFEAEGGLLTITPLRNFKPDQIVAALEDMSQSSKSPLELESPELTLTIKFVTPPSGSGVKRRKELMMKDVMEMASFGKKRPRMVDDDYDGDDEEDGGVGFFDDVVEVAGEEEEDEDDFDEEVVDESMRGKIKSNIMKNDVELNCLPHALLQSRLFHDSLHADTPEMRKWAARMLRKSIEKSDGKTNSHEEVYEEMRKMKKEANIDKDADFDIVDIEAFQQSVFAGTHQIVVVVEGQRLPYFSGPFVGHDRVLPIFLDEAGHFSGARKLPALLGVKYYCTLCDARFATFGDHYNCKSRHRLCGSVSCPPPKDDDVPEKCKKCQAIFPSKECYTLHLDKGPKKGKSRCDQSRFCKKCKKTYYVNKTATHVCGKRYCRRCQSLQAPKHHCMLTVAEKNEERVRRRRIFYDFESREDEVTGEQVPVLFIAIKTCPECAEATPNTLQEVLSAVCAKCSPSSRCKVIESITDENRFVDVAAESVEWLFSKENRGCVALAHNSSGYDAQFIFRKLAWSKRATPKVITAGTKIISLAYKGVRLIDSLKYLTMSLSSVGKAFKLEMEKGDFPVKFIRPENYEYIGPLPGNEEYSLATKMPEVRRQMEKFLDEERARGAVFNFQEELMRYCFKDVWILAKALTAFEKDFERLTDVCLFSESCTAASAAMMAFRRKHLNHHHPIVLDARPSVAVQWSIVSQKYLAWMGHAEDVDVEFSTSSGERKVGDYSVDGFVDVCEKYPRGLVVEFHGCFWHAHSCRYSDESVIGDHTGREIRERDAKRIEELANQHEVRVVWECEVDAELRVDKEMARFFDTYEAVDIIELEKALVGGRTEVFRIKADNNGKSMKYADVVSLYPTCMKYEAYPFGPPTHVPRSSFQVPITHPDELKIRGFVKCCVVAPERCRLPLLPIKMDGKLMFALCRSCALLHHQGSCPHDEKDRAFTGTFTTVELKKALEVGYKITRVDHAIEYVDWAENDENGQGGLFTSYINEMMVEKIYASGWPDDVKTDEEKLRFVEEYCKREGIVLNDFSRFAVVHGARQSAKLLLNCLWGKFAQRVDVPQTEIIQNPAKFWKMFHNSAIVMEDVWDVNDTLMVRWRSRKETMESLRTSAMHLAAYVTSYARLRLYRLMEKVGGDNIVYTDTDSVVYMVPDGCDDPLASEMGPFLGQLTNELKGEMLEFVSLGPKSYAYKERMEDGSEKVARKLKGITLNSEADKRVTFDIMKEMVEEVLEEVADPTVVMVKQQAVRRSKGHEVFFKKMDKKLRFTFNKRRILADGSTLPFGYKDL